jgi:hypothetical protein
MFDAIRKRQISEWRPSRTRLSTAPAPTQPDHKSKPLENVPTEVSQSQPVVGAPALADLAQVFFGRGGGALELLAGKHVRL